MRSLFRLFAKPHPKVELAVSSPAQAAPASGLVIVETLIRAEPEAEGLLRVFVGGARRPDLQKPVKLGREAEKSWLAVHGHLLPNGPVDIRVEVRGAGNALLAEAALTVQVRNEGALAAQVAQSLRRTEVPWWSPAPSTAPSTTTPTPR